ncbi:30S ribosomal protein S6 [Entomobacter blattae]|uniref:Small ribosomal subunit protein bS6 n=1 Tax=Entomobacter blattae TaxID=2762277 RepID=A0A7H1NV17_9PROT|nr:30S ribosomal protein S6 [Entomobacter blattae]QNT79627.1 30S ribosomal protein S6 [Entomobacter blattae]
MPFYECVFIARNDVTQQQVEAVADNITSLLESEGGAVRKREYWGLRSLSYRIKKNRKGHYMLLGLEAKPESIKEMERQMNLNEDVLRFLTLRIEEIDPNPSVGMSRKNDERPERSAGRGNNPRGASSSRYDSGRRKGYDAQDEFDEDQGNLSTLAGEEE